MLIEREQIAGMIPHAGSMCLLHGVLRWDSEGIACVARNHRDDGNPLRAGGMLPVLCGIEYAAQAMAVHGGLSGVVDGRPRAGFLAAVRDVRCAVRRLDDIAGDLLIEAVRQMGDAGRVVYGFVLRAGDTELLSGRATVVLDAAELRT